jgi:hypothetical protein
LVCTAFEVIIGEVLVRGVFVGFLLEDIVDRGLRLLRGGLGFKWIRVFFVIVIELISKVVVYKETIVLLFWFLLVIYSF